MAQKKKRIKIKDQIYNGAFEHVSLTKSSKFVLLGASTMVILSAMIAHNIEK